VFITQIYLESKFKNVLLFLVRYQKEKKHYRKFIKLPDICSYNHSAFYSIAISLDISQQQISG